MHGLALCFLHLLIGEICVGMYVCRYVHVCMRAWVGIMLPALVDRSEMYVSARSYVHVSIRA
jgi:hypothetical protein